MPALPLAKAAINLDAPATSTGMMKIIKPKYLKTTTMKKNIYRMMLTVVASVLLLPLGLAAQTRIAVVSDIHYIDPEDSEVDNTSQRKMLAQSEGLLNQFVAKMNAEEPDILLITGDLTEKGDADSHEYVAGQLASLKSKGIKVFVIPGNHDCGAEVDFASIYNGYGYVTDNTNNTGITHITNITGTLGYVATLDDDLVLLAIDSHNPDATTATLNWLNNPDNANVFNGQRVIAMMHHPLFPHIVGGDMFVDSYTVDDYENVRNALINAGVNVILTGHFHTSDIAYDWNNDETNGIYDINTGSLVSYPCDYRMLTLSADKTKLSVTTKSLVPSDMTAEECKTWLQERMAAKAKSEIEPIVNLYISLPFISDEDKQMASEENIIKIASFSAKLFVLHAEGNENLSADRGEIVRTYNNLKGQFGRLLTMAGINDNSIYSILDDKSYHGNAQNNETNQTNDRTLTIDLDAPSSLLIDINNGSENKSSIDYYNKKTANVTLTGRTLYKDGKWNTLCLPFDMSLDNETLAGCTLKELDDMGTYDDNGNASNDGSNRTGFDANTGVLSLYFKDANSIVAGTPYLIKWDNGNNIDNPTFSDVEINKTVHSVTVGEGSNSVSFLGTYNAKAFNATDKSILLVGVSDEGSTLYYPEEGASIGACRAYFKIGEDGAQARAIKAFNLNFGDNNQTTGIENIQGAMAKAQSGVWYTLNGMKLSQQPIRKGLYIHNGKKVAVE